MIEKLETSATPRCFSQFVWQVLDGLCAQKRRIVRGLSACIGRKDAQPRKKKISMNFSRSSSTGIWYNAAMREISHRRGF
ncbi:MAG: hypothetical protein GX768_04015 [Chloroflexi bacterium]|nr:hypothetical protein [Chloroflexota bacterium]